MKLSVIIPVYNNPEFFTRFINCIKKQDILNCEFLIIDDGSDINIYNNLKNTVEKAKDQRIKIIRLENNSGYGHAVNIGFKHAIGEYIGIYEPDDIIPQDFYSDLVKISNLYGTDIVKYNGLIRRKDDIDSVIFSYSKKYINKIITMQSYKRLGYSHPSITNAIYKKKFIERNNIKFCHGAGASFQDQQFRVRLWYTNPSVFIVDKVKYIYYSHPNQSVKNHDSKVGSIIKNWEEEYLELSKNNFGIEFFLYSYFRQINGIKKKVSIGNYNKLKKHYFKVFNKGNFNLKKMFLLKKSLSEFFKIIVFSVRKI